MFMQIPTLDPDLLRSFIAIVDLGGIARAAEAVGRTQSAVSMQMQRLEDLTGRALLRRQGRGTALTPAGEILVPHARRLLRAQEEAWRDLVQPPLSGQVRLGMPDDYAARLLPGPLARFAAEHPAVSVQLYCEPSSILMGLMVEGALDLAIVTRPDGWRGEALRFEPVIWVAAEDFDLGRRPLPVALYRDGCPARDRARQALALAGIDWREAYGSDSMTGLLAAVRAGLAVAALPACAAPPEMRRLTAADGLPLLGPSVVGLAVAEQASSPALAMAALLRSMVS